MPEIARKADAARIVAHLDALAASDWIGTARKWWPKYIFHFAELRNVVAILESGELRARILQPMAVDTASPGVISHTEEEWRRHVRFYFRPRTPTQHQCEGFRPPADRGSAGAHSPMPFVFLFDAKDLLTREAARFSNGNLAKHGHGTEVGNTADFFEQIPFQEVYHNSPFSAEDRDLIVNRRHAEIIIPERIDLAALRFIGCRSVAERQTLVNSLNPETCGLYAPKITTQGQGTLHFRQWTYVEEVSLEQKRAVFRFNPSTQSPGPFTAEINIKAASGMRLRWRGQVECANQSLTLNLSHLTSAIDYEIELTLDGNRAYLGRFIASETALSNPPLF